MKPSQSSDFFIFIIDKMFDLSQLLKSGPIPLNKVNIPLGKLYWREEGLYAFTNQFGLYTKGNTDRKESWDVICGIDSQSMIKCPWWLEEILKKIKFKANIPVYYRGNPDYILVRIDGQYLVNPETDSKLEFSTTLKNMKSVLEVEKIINDLPKYSTLFPIETDLLIKYE